MLKLIVNSIIFGFSGFAGSLVYSQLYIPWKEKKKAEHARKMELFKYVNNRGVTLYEFFRLIEEISDIESDSSAINPSYNMHSDRFSKYELSQLVASPTRLNHRLSSYVLKLLFNSSGSSDTKKRKEKFFYDFAESVKTYDTKEEGVTIPYVV